MKSKRLAIFAGAIICLVDLSSCGTTSFAPPPVTTELASAGARQHVDLATLHEGRAPFNSRCIECHTLPAATPPSPTERPRLIDEMAARASMKSPNPDPGFAHIRTPPPQSPP